jgi:HAD superfamily hydrolase (TIGR01509 family)
MRTHTFRLSDKAILQLLQPPDSVVPREVPWELKKPTLGLRGADWIPMVLQWAVQEWKMPTDQIPTLQEFWESWEDLLNEYSEQEVEACPGAAELVDVLDRASVPMAIATSSRASAVARKRKRHEKAFSKMRCVVTGDDPGVANGKPAPDIYLEAARRLNVSPEECLVLEDALAGVQAGKAAGCAVAVVPDSRFTAKEKAVFVREGADVVLDSWWDFQGEPFGLPAKVDMKAMANLPN